MKLKSFEDACKSYYENNKDRYSRYGIYGISENNWNQMLNNGEYLDFEFANSDDNVVFVTDKKTKHMFIVPRVCIDESIFNIDEVFEKGSFEI